MNLNRNVTGITEKIWTQPSKKTDRRRAVIPVSAVVLSALHSGLGEHRASSCS